MKDIAIENARKSKYTDIVVKKLPNGCALLAVVWKKTNKVVSVYFRGLSIQKIGSFNTKDKKKKRIFDKVVAEHFQEIV
tara:strand:+ start:378 stop:614 length:237 start_codon:yes stop_codon:yes gene_type:complete